MSENDEQPQRGNGAWWLLWISSTVVLPAIAGTLVFQGNQYARIFAIALCFISFGLNLGSSFRLDPKTGCLLLFLSLGGWLLMVASFFLGCVSNGLPHH